MSKVKVIEINGQAYLGTLVEGKKSTTLKDAAVCDTSPTERDFMRYLESRNNNNLITKEYRGKGQGLDPAVSKLTDKQKMQFKICKMHMKQSVAGAVRELQNDHFRKSMGK